MAMFTKCKKLLDNLIEIEAKIRSNGLEQKMAHRHSEETIHNFIDLIGYTKREALDITIRRLAITQESLDNGEIRPNLGNGRDHIFKIIAHKGKHSKKGGVLKFAIKEYLEYENYDHHQDMEHGVFLVRLQI